MGEGEEIHFQSLHRLHFRNENWLKPARRMGNKCCRESHTTSAEEQAVFAIGPPSAGDAGAGLGGSSVGNGELYTDAKEAAARDPLESPTSTVHFVFKNGLLVPQNGPLVPQSEQLEIAEPRAKALLEALRPLVADFRILDAEELVAGAWPTS